MWLDIAILAFVIIGFMSLSNQVESIRRYLIEKEIEQEENNSNTDFTYE